MQVRKLQLNNNKTYFISVPKLVIETLDWKKFDKIHFTLGEGKVMLRKLDEVDENAEHKNESESGTDDNRTEG